MVCRLLRHFWMLFHVTVTAWLDDRAQRLGASLAFYSILSLAPLLLLLMQVAGPLLGNSTVEQQVVSQLKDLVGVQGLDAVKYILHAARHREESGWFANALTFGLMLFGASGVFHDLQDALNIIWKVPPKPRPVLAWLREKLFAFLMVGCVGLLLFASLAVSTVLNAFTQLAQHWLPITATLQMHRLDFFVSFFVSMLLFALVFKIVPDKRIQWSHLWPGAALTALLFVVGKYLIGFYLAQTGLASVFGTAGSVIILLIWVYYTAQILFFGAEFTHAVDVHGLRSQQRPANNDNIP
jgi:membrane protein